MLLSIIVPVYNIENYLTKNIESLIAIEDENVEFIYINDGSTDRGLEILHAYQKEDERISVYSFPNGGLSKSRNRGIERARGKYIMFVDGDDYIASSEIAHVVEICEENEIDVLHFNHCHVDENDKFLSYGSSVFEKGRELDFVTGREILLSRQAMLSPWGYVYRTDFLKQNNLYFLEGILHEDMEFTPRMLLCAEKMGKVGLLVYYYVQRKGSITRSRNIRKQWDLLAIGKEYMEYKKTIVDDVELQKCFEEYTCRLFVQAIHAGILENYSFKEVLQTRENKRMVMHELLKSSDLRYRFLAVMIAIGADKLYSRLYLTKSRKN